MTVKKRGDIFMLNSSVRDDLGGQKERVRVS